MAFVLPKLVEITLMKNIYLLCLMLTLSVAAYGQQPGANPNPMTAGEPQPDSTGQRLQYLLRNANELEQAGNVQQAAVLRQQADQERQSLMRRIDVLQAEIDQIRKVTSAGAQVKVKIQILEVSLTKLRSLGMDITNLYGGVQIFDPNANIHDQLFSLVDNVNAQQMIEALRKDNLVKVLAEPIMVTPSGRTASMRGGNEFSIPRLQPDGTTKMEPQYGTEVEVTPEVLGDKVRMALHIRLAEPDYARSVTVGKEVIPGVKSHECVTRVDIQNGKSIILRGPTRVREESENVGVPYLSEIPYAGAVIRKVKTTKNELEMLIVVQPEIMQSSPAAEPPSASFQNASKPSTLR
jgi:pilus assembly protein CpaC